MAAEAEKQVGAGSDALVQVEALHAAAAALALAVLIHRDHDDRAARCFSTSREATMPMTPGCQFCPQSRMTRSSKRPGSRSSSSCAALTISCSVSCRETLISVQPVGQLLGPVRVLTEDQLQGGDGAVHPARRIDAGRNGVADILRRDGLARKAYFFQQSHQARAVGLLQLPQARFDQGSVLPRQGHHVSHRAHGGQVAAVIQHLLRRAAVQRRAELECHARAAQALKGAGVVGPAGIHHGHSLGQHLVAADGGR